MSSGKFSKPVSGGMGCLTDVDLLIKVPCIFREGGGGGGGGWGQKG